MNLSKGIKHVLMAEANDGAGAGAAGGGAAGDGGAAQAGAADASAAAGGAGQGDAQGAGAGATNSSALASAAGAAASAEGAGGVDWIPEKHRVTKADGSLDLEASSRKVADAHRALEQRLGSGDVAPKDPSEYAPKVEIEGFQWDEFKADPEMQGFLKGAHAKGITNDQLSFVLAEYYPRAMQLAEGAGQLSVADCDTALQKAWTTPEAVHNNKIGAYRVFEAFAEKAGVTMEEMEASGAANNPAVMKLLAAIAPELGEDRGVSGIGSGGQEKIEDLLVSEAYTDPKHKDHKLVSEKIRKHYASQYGNQPAL